MPLYYFVLKTNRQTIADPDGQELPDDTAAQAHAMAVAQQLMRNREYDTRLWRIQVCDDYLRPLFNVQFVEADKTIERFPAAVQAVIKDAARMHGGLQDAVSNMRSTLSDVRMTLAKADRILAAIPRARLG